jgi:branched-chain amino acid transport system substrate-binding protein
MLPYTGTYAQLGVAIENGLRLALEEGGGKLGGREVEFLKVDDESEPAKVTDNANVPSPAPRSKSHQLRACAWQNRH